MRVCTEKEIMRLVVGLSEDVAWKEQCQNMSLDEALNILKENKFSVCLKKKGSEHICTYCEKPYKKQDFALCPHCGADGGGITTRVWKPNKHQRKEYAKKMSEN